MEIREFVLLRKFFIVTNVSRRIESNIAGTKVSGALLMALLREKVIQRANADYFDKN